MTRAVDTNVLLDVLIPNTRFADSSRSLLESSMRQGALIIGEVVYGELASQFPTYKELDKFIEETGIRFVNIGKEGLQIASEAWELYLGERDHNVQCPECGKVITIYCDNCQTEVSTRQHLLSDFMVAGHALEQADALITRDLGFYRNHFDDLEILSPSD